MAKVKIRKDLSDADMFAGAKEEASFEERMLEAERDAKPGAILRKPVKSGADEFYKEFLTEKLEAQIGKMLLDIKMEYFRDDVKDFSIQVKRDGRNIVLETAPKAVKR